MQGPNPHTPTPRDWRPFACAASAVFFAVGIWAVQALAADTGPVITFLGIADTQGCLACPNVPNCLCDPAIPTPTPEIDANNRRVFHTRSGVVLVVVEGKAGTSGKPPRNRLTDSLPDGRPDLLAEVSNELGNGDPQINCAIPNGDGVPKVDPPDFGAGTAITNALVDMACRFGVFVDSFDVSVPNDPCTLSSSGAPRLANPEALPSIQFCSSRLGFGQAFHPGKTVVTARLRDDNLNLGPPVQIVVDVNTPGPTATPTVTPGGPFGVSGTIRYVNSALPVDAVIAQLQGPAPTAMLTGSGGDFSFGNLAGATWTVRPVKLGGGNNSISAGDAVAALQTAVHLRTLNATEQLMCDVNGDARVSAVDAVLMLQFRVQLITSFPVAQTCGSAWVFTPAPVAAPNQQTQLAAISRTSCTLASISWTPLASLAQQQDFIGGLFGDCSTNWRPLSGGAAAERALGPASAVVRLGQPIRRGRRLRVAVHVDGAETFQGLDADIRYDATQLQFLGLRRARGMRGALTAVNEPEPGRVAISMASATPLHSGAVLVARFKVTGSRASLHRIRPLRLVYASVDG